MPCGVDCGAGQCSGGKCQCPSSLTTCGVAPNTECVDIRRDPENCGACGRACSLTQSCTSGVCTP
jgi:hypothetical protein